MAARDVKRARFKLVPVLLLTAVFCVFYICSVAALTPHRYDYKAGDIALENISSPVTIENTEATQTLKEIARNEVSPVYVLDQSLIDEYKSGAQKFFDDIDALRESTKAYAEDERPIQQALSEGELKPLLEKFDIELSVDEGYGLIQTQKSELLRLQDAIMPKLTSSLESGVNEQSISARVRAYVQELDASTMPELLKRLGEKALNEYLKPTYIEDEKATNQARELAASKVQPVEIKRGDIIVRANEIITRDQYELMCSLELIRADNADMWLYIGLAIYIALIGIAFYAYLLIFCPGILKNPKNMLIICSVMALSIAAALALNALGRPISSSLLGVLLVALLVEHRCALGVNVVLSLAVGLICGGRGSSMMGSAAQLMTVSSLIGGQAAVYALRGTQKRGAIISSGAIAGLSGGLIAASINIMTAKPLMNVLLSAAWPLCSDLVAALLVAGILPFFEIVFDVATSARLNELSNTNHPLLRQLMTEAPGTYHHSMMTAALAESAAQAIGADALLARVGAYYHDVGKLRRPLYFKENQKPNENIHDSLPPLESASIILAHQKDGVAMLVKQRLPSAVVEIAFEHHGTTMAAYFYHKARQEKGMENISQKPFRYPGARPSTKESAIVLLADSAEAAVRSLSSPTREEIEDLVGKIIKGKIDDGQLALSPLNFKEITIIHQSFLRSLNGLLHERIAYPGQEGS